MLVTSGLDIWCKRVDYLVVDRWYNKGHDHYHHDEGEGMDMYNVGTSRGAGGTGIWDGRQLYVGRNYQNWKVIANGPIRAIFELSYETWTAGALTVSEVKRFTVDAGHNLDQIESIFTAEVGPKTFTVAIGLNKDSGDKGQNDKIVATVTKRRRLAQPMGSGKDQWLARRKHHRAVWFGGLRRGSSEPARTRACDLRAGAPLLRRFRLVQGGRVHDPGIWNAYVAACAARLKSPVKITLTP